jgi:hypothetical protein
MTTSLKRRTRIFCPVRWSNSGRTPRSRSAGRGRTSGATRTARSGCCCSTIERLGHRYALQNPRIVNLKAAERRLPGALRPFFRAADFPGYVLLDEAPQTSSRARSGAA